MERLRWGGPQSEDDTQQRTEGSEQCRLVGDWFGFQLKEQPVYMGPEPRSGRPVMVKEQHRGSGGTERASVLAASPWS